jgi:Tol biopolymer transport system component
LKRFDTFAAALGLLVLAACADRPRDSGERIFFASGRGGPEGTVHIWSIAPGGVPSSLRQETFGPSSETYPRVSPDGSVLAFARAVPGPDGTARLWVRVLATGEETQITGETTQSKVSEIEPFWAPGGSALGFTRIRVGDRPGDPHAATLWSVGVDRTDRGIRPGALSRLASDAGPTRTSGSWNPVTGGDIVFAIRGQFNTYSIWRVTRPGGVESEAIPHGCCGNYLPAYSPDGRHVAYVSFAHDRKGDLYVVDTRRWAPRRVTCESGWGRPAWSPEGTELVAHRDSRPGLWRIAVPVTGQPCNPQPIQVTTGGHRDDMPDWVRIGPLH